MTSHRIDVRNIKINASAKHTLEKDHNFDFNNVRLLIQKMITPKGSKDPTIKRYKNPIINRNHI